MSDTVKIEMGSAVRLMDRLMMQTSPLRQAQFLTGVVSPYLSAEAESRFADSVNPDDTPWEPLEDSTVSWRESLGFTPGTKRGEINVRTGKLRDWLAYPAIAVAPAGDGAVMQWPSRSSVGADMEHRLAQAAGRRKGPARWVIGYHARDIGFIVGAMEKFIVRGAK